MVKTAAISTMLLHYLITQKKRVKELGLAGPGKIRVNKAGCLDRCADGPVMVVYPQGIWYTLVDVDDVEEIIQSHLIAGRPVERLRLA